MGAIGRVTVLDKETCKYLGFNSLVTLKYLVSNPGELQIIQNGETEVVGIHKEETGDYFPVYYIVVNKKRLDLDLSIKWHNIYESSER